MLDCRLQKQIYAPPSRYVVEKQEAQCDMERAFEDMYLQATGTAVQYQFILSVTRLSVVHACTVTVTFNFFLLVNLQIIWVT